MRLFRGGGGLKRSIPVGVTAIALLVVFALFTVARVGFEVSRILPRERLEWLFVSQLSLRGDDSSLAEFAKVMRNGSDPRRGGEALESFRVAEIRPNPGSESVAVVRNVTAPVDASGGESEGLGESVANESVLVEESEASSEWDPGWGDRSSAEELDKLADEKESTEDSSDPSEESSDTGPIAWRYDVCVLVKIGGRSGGGGGDGGRRSVPFGEFYRLFNAAKGAPNGTRPWKTLRERRLFVGADFADILCLMVRDDLGPEVECTNYNRFGVTTNQCKHVVMGGGKKYSLQPSLDELRRYSFVWDSMEVVNLDADDQGREQPSLPESEWRPTIVTGFSSKYVDVGLLLLRSVGKMAVDQTNYNVSVVVWTMGKFPPVARRAVACVVEELKSVYNVPTEVRRFDFRAWPDWMRLNQKLGPDLGTGEYAWKAVMIHTVLRERGFVVWADASDRFRTVSALTMTLSHVKRKGFASRYAGGYVKDLTHVKQLEYFGANRHEVINMPYCDVSCVGFTLRRYTQLARPWYECSIIRQCIAPEGSSRGNHRQDQSALTILAALSGDSCEGVDFFVSRKIGSFLNSHSIGVNATQCYMDPLTVKWQS